MSKKRGYSCPVCDEIFSKEDLPKHVDLHFDEEGREFADDVIACTFSGCDLILNIKDMEDHLVAHEVGEENNTIVESSRTSSYAMTDSMLAMIIQNEENSVSQKVHQNTDLDHATAQKIQREEEKKLELKEFQKLQDKYGMNSKGGYSKQFEDQLQKKAGRNKDISEYFKKKANLHAAMLSGIDSNDSRTRGLIQNLKGIYACGVAGVTQYYLCTDTDHYCSDEGDHGWGCGYRNLQMLLSSMLKISPFKETISKGIESSDVPSVPRLQTLIEKAWENGYDVSGCEQLGGKLQDTKKWIGATEVVTLLRWLGVRARIVDFHQASADKTHPLLFEWIANYFKTNKAETNPAFPLYLQHQGHSRLCVGVEESSQENNQLLIFDPLHTKYKMVSIKNFKLPCTKTELNDWRKSLNQMNHSQYQLAFIDGLYKNDKERQESKILNAIRMSRGIL